MPGLRPLKPTPPPLAMSPKLQTFLKRLLSTVILIAVLAGVVIWHHPLGYAALICVLCNLCTIEWYRMLSGHAQESNRWLILAAGLIYPWAMAWITLCPAESFDQLEGNPFDFSPELQESLPITLFAFKYLMGYTLLAFVLELLRMDYRGQGAQQALRSLGTTLLAFIFPVWLFCFALQSLLDFPFNIFPLLWLIIVTKLCDVYAYVCGVLVGGKLIKRPFSPAVSPKKTWEGIIGSFILTAITGWLLMEPMVGDLSVAAFFIVVMPCIFVFSVAGDLAGSLIKRGLGVKDSGSLLPGIGGIYDLLDSPAFTIALVVLTISL